MNIQAFIFAAGRGTRLMPLTQETPKALVDINGQTFLEIVIKRLKNAKINDFVINVHHHAQKIRQYLEANDNFGVNIQISDETNWLLDTGGAIKKAASLFKPGPVLVHNVDVITDMDYNDLINYHIDQKSLITLAVRNRKTSRYFLFDKTGYLCGWRNLQTREEKITRGTSYDLEQLAFSGIHVFSYNLPDLLKQTGVFSIVDAYIHLASVHSIRAYRHDHTFWEDIGKPDQLAAFRLNTPDFLKTL